MNKLSTGNTTTLTARLSAILLVVGAMAPTAFAQTAKAVQDECAKATEQALIAEKKKMQACPKPATATNAAKAKKPANPCAPAARKKKASNPCA